MARTDLKTTSGFPLVFDGETLNGDKFTFEEESVSIDDIRKQLLNQDLNCPEVFYRKFSNIDSEGIYKSKKLNVSFYAIKPNLAGIEYIKTKATRNENYPRLLEAVHGGGIVLMQKYQNVRDNKVVKTSIKKGEKMIIPSGYSVSFVNTRQSSTFIIAEYQSIKAETKSVLDDRDGMAYYIIRKNAKQEIVRNPNYKIVNQPETIDWEKFNSEYGITPKTPIIKQIIRKYEKFDWLFKQNSVSI